MAVDLFEIGMDRSDLCVGEKIAGHHPATIVDTFADLFDGRVTDIRPVECDVMSLPVGVFGDRLPGTGLAVALGTAGATRIVVEHLPVFEIGDEIFAPPCKRQSEEKNEFCPQTIYPAKLFSI